MMTAGDCEVRMRWALKGVLRELSGEWRRERSKDE